MSEMGCSSTWIPMLLVSVRIGRELGTASNCDIKRAGIKMLGAGIGVEVLILLWMWCPLTLDFGEPLDAWEIICVWRTGTMHNLIFAEPSCFWLLLDLVWKASGDAIFEIGSERAGMASADAFVTSEKWFEHLVFSCAEHLLCHSSCIQNGFAIVFGDSKTWGSVLGGRSIWFFGAAFFKVAFVTSAWCSSCEHKCLEMIFCGDRTTWRSRFGGRSANFWVTSFFKVAFATSVVAIARWWNFRTSDKMLHVIEIQGVQTLTSLEYWSYICWCGKMCLGWP